MIHSRNSIFSQKVENPTKAGKLASLKISRQFSHLRHVDEVATQLPDVVYDGHVVSTTVVPELTRRELVP